MSFVSPEFGLFCLLFLPVYWALASRPDWQRGLLILTGYGLYATWVPKFAVFLCVYSTAMWALGRRMQSMPASRRPLWLGLWLAGTFLLSLKYYEFVRETFQAVLQTLARSSRSSVSAASRSSEMAWPSRSSGLASGPTCGDKWNGSWLAS